MNSLPWDPSSWQDHFGPGFYKADWSKHHAVREASSLKTLQRDSTPISSSTKGVVTHHPLKPWARTSQKRKSASSHPQSAARNCSVWPLQETEFQITAQRTMFTRAGPLHRDAARAGSADRPSRSLLGSLSSPVLCLIAHTKTFSGFLLPTGAQEYCSQQFPPGPAPDWKTWIHTWCFPWPSMTGVGLNLHWAVPFQMVKSILTLWTLVQMLLPLWSLFWDPAPKLKAIPPSKVHQCHICLKQQMCFCISLLLL